MIEDIKETSYPICIPEKLAAADDLGYSKEEFWVLMRYVVVFGSQYAGQ